MAGGRPRKYVEGKTAKQAYKLCLLGSTDEELADFFEIAVSTLYKWKKDFPEFSEALKKGKVVADANVAQSLFKKANGFKYKESKQIVVNGKVTEKQNMVKQCPPDTGAGIFWLKNRARDKWKDKHEDTTNETPPITINIVNPDAD